MDRALFGTAIAFPASLYCFTDLILHNRFLQAPQQGLCFVEEKAQILGTKLVRRTAKSTDIAPVGFSIDKRRLDKMLTSMVGPALFRNLTLPRRPPSFAHSRPDEAISRYLESFDRYGIPFNVVYGPAAPEGIVLPEILTAQVVMQALEGATITRVAED